MALVRLPTPMHYPSSDWFNNASFPSVGSISLSTSGYYNSYIFSSPVTDSITKIGFRTGNTSAGSYDVRIETVDAATGFPSGTLWGTNTNFVQSVLSSDDNTWFEVTLTAAANVNRGDILAVKVAMNATFSGGLGSFAGFNKGQGFPTCIRNNSGTPAAIANAPVIYIYYQNAGYVFHDGLLPVNSFTSITFNNTSTPDVVGNKITPSFACTVSGFWAHIDFDGAGVMKLYDSDGVSVLGSASFDATTGGGTANPTKIIGTFGSDISLKAGTSYYLGIEPSSGTSLSTYSMDFYDANTKKMYVDSSVIYSTAKDPSGTGSWTDESTKSAPMGIIINAIDDGINRSGLHPIEQGIST
jgi:hypothetical protein